MKMRFALLSAIFHIAILKSGAIYGSEMDGSTASAGPSAVVSLNEERSVSDFRAPS